MSLKTKSAFIYGHQITDENYILDINEGSGEVAIYLDVGDYTLTDFIDMLSTALNTYGSNTYSVSVNRTTRIITISADGTFKILGSTGTHIGNDPLSLMGYAYSDTSLATSHAASSATGSIWEPQFYLQDFVDFDDNVQSIEGVQRESTSGQVEVVSFGKRYIMECNIKLITDIKQGSSSWITSDSSGVSSARTFLNYVIDKAPVEFIPDKNSVDDFTECLLESTPESQEGLAFKLKEMYSQGLIGYFETGPLKFRRV